MRRLTVVALVIVTLAVGCGDASSSNTETHDRDDREVILFTGAPTSFALDLDGFPTIVATIEGMTTEGPVTITDTVGSSSDDILLGSSHGGTDGEHIVSTSVWDFGGGDTLTTDNRTFISPILVTETCDEFVPNDLRSVITGGTGQLANAIGDIQTAIDPFCTDDAFAGLTVPVTGSIDGLIVLPHGNDS